MQVFTRSLTPLPLRALPVIFIKNQFLIQNYNFQISIKIIWLLFSFSMVNSPLLLNFDLKKTQAIKLKYKSQFQKNKSIIQLSLNLMGEKSTFGAPINIQMNCILQFR